MPFGSVAGNGPHFIYESFPKCRDRDDGGMKLVCGSILFDTTSIDNRVYMTWMTLSVYVSGILRNNPVLIRIYKLEMWKFSAFWLFGGPGHGSCVGWVGEYIEIFHLVHISFCFMAREKRISFHFMCGWLFFSSQSPHRVSFMSFVYWKGEMWTQYFSSIITTRYSAEWQWQWQWRGVQFRWDRNDRSWGSEDSSTPPK